MSQQINLYHASLRKQKARIASRHAPIIFAAMLLAFAGLYGYVRAKTAELRETAAEARQGLERNRARLAEFAQGAGGQRLKLLEAEAVRLEGELEKRRQLVAALSSGELGNTAGFSEVLAAFGRRDLPGVWLTSFSVSDAGRSLHVEGRALNASLVPAYLEALGAEPMMQGRRVAELKLAARSAEVQKPPAVGAPQRFVEFSISAPMAQAGKPAASGAAK